MLKTYDFVVIAQKNLKVKKQIEDFIYNAIDGEISLENFKLIFNSQTQRMIVKAASTSRVGHEKIVPKSISYHAVLKMINHCWDIEENEIIDVS